MESVKTVLLFLILVLLVVSLLDGRTDAGTAQLVVTDPQQAYEIINGAQGVVDNLSPQPVNGSVTDIIQQPQPQPVNYGGATDGSDPNAGGGAGDPNSQIVPASEQQVQQVQQAVIVKDTAVITGLMDGVQPQPDLNSEGIVVTTTRKDTQGNTWAGKGRIFAAPGSPHTTQECFAAYLPGSENAPALEGCGLIWEWTQK